MPPETQRFAVIDAFKFLGIFFIVLIHASSLFDQSGEFAYDTLNLMSRVVVPIYFMISGYFIENKQNDFSIWRKTIWRLFVPYFVWSLIYLAIPNDWVGLLINGHPSADYASWTQEVKKNYFQHTIPVGLILSGGKGHLWFLFALMASVTASAFLRRFIGGNIVLCIAAFLFGIGLLLVPYRESPLGINVNWGTHNGGLSLGYVGALIGFLYFELGRLISRRKDDIFSVRAAVYILIVGLVFTECEGALLHIKFGYSIQQKFYLLGTVPYGLGLFVLLLHCKNIKVPEWLSRSGRYSLGMYTMHMLLVEAVVQNIPAQGLGPGLLIVAAIFILTALMSRFLVKFRILNKIMT